MSVHLQRQIDSLKKAIVALGTRVEEAVDQAILAVEQRDSALAMRIIAEDEEIDQMEVDIEEECLKTLALHQPVAFDLRYVIAVLKINNDLERIADLAANIAEQGDLMSREACIELPPLDVRDMKQKVQLMLRGSLDALIHTDGEQAQAVRQMDNAVDAIHRQVYDNLEMRTRKDPQDFSQLLHYLTISRCLERIADHAVNIAEDVLYLSCGEILRHTEISG